MNHLDDNKLTCFAIHVKYNSKCQKQSCRQWLNCEKFNNCTLSATLHGPLTLNEIEDITNLTKTKVYNIENRIKRKLNIIFNDQI